MIGKTVGRFRITAKLGEGGMGSVWKAEDSLLGRSIALKFLPAALATQPEARRRFLREAQAASALEHPGSATVHEAGEADGLVYIAMQLVDGETLSDLAARGPLPVAEAVRIATSAAEALAHAHTRGVLHRDISARNIMVHRDGRVVVVDFGLALPEGQPRLTQSTAAMGTVAYMSPEVALGKRADRRSDLYGLGVVLYELLTGTLPFEAEQPQALLYATVHAAVEPPSARRGDVPAELDRVVLKALAKDPARRYQTADELAADLRTLWASLPGGTPPQQVLARSRESAVTLPIEPLAITPGASETSIGRSRRTRITRSIGGVVILAFTALVVILARTGLFRGGARPEAKEPSVAVLPLRFAGSSPGEFDYFADGISEALVTRLTQLPGLRVTPWMTSQRFTDAKRSPTDIAHELGVDILVVGTFRGSSDSIQATVSLVDGKTGFQRWADDFVQPRKDVFTVQRQIAIQVATRLRGKLTGEEEKSLGQPASKSAEAYEYYLRATYALQRDDREAYDVALSLFEKAIALDSSFAMAYVGAGAMRTAQHSMGWETGSLVVDQAEANFVQALKLDPGLARARRGLIRVHIERDEDEECLKIGKEVERLGLDDVENLLVRADAYHYGTLFDKAEPLYRRVLELDPANEAAQAIPPVNYVCMGKYREAIESGQAYLDKFGYTWEVLTFVAEAFFCLGDFDSTRAYIQRYDPTHSVSSYAWLPPDLVPPEEVRRGLLSDIADAQKGLKSDPANAEILSDLALAHARLGDRRALEMDEARIPTSTPSIAVLRNLARAHAALGDSTRAIELLRMMVHRGGRYHFWNSCPEVIGLSKLVNTAGYRQLVKDLQQETDRLRAMY
jgi:serine/threonine-protein kinase